MKQFFSLLTVCGVLAGACSTSGGGVESVDDPGSTTAEPGRVAGGQSGNDGTGSYFCDLSDPTVTETPVDTAPMSANCSPADAVSALRRATTALAAESPDPEHSVVFRCGAFGRYVVDVEPASSAQLLTGSSPSDTSEETPDVPCVAFVVESAINVQSLDGELSFEGHQFDTDHLCGRASFSAVRADGAKLSGEGEIGMGAVFALKIESGDTSVVCSRTGDVYPEPTEPDPTEPTPNTGGAGGEGGTHEPGGSGGEGGEGGASQ